MSKKNEVLAEGAVIYRSLYGEVALLSAGLVGAAAYCFDRHGAERSHGLLSARALS
ncbi:hypothetical protein [Desulfotalea psychrophila]|uniref:hypothetical protein n=1 Tax=Desulfotalea psychrophila TaxID=84980 RepID=UPI0002EADD88|nr:hypothetical protein [Desulfotalea psychrophila]